MLLICYVGHFVLHCSLRHLRRTFACLFLFRGLMTLGFRHMLFFGESIRRVCLPPLSAALLILFWRHASVRYRFCLLRHA